MHATHFASRVVSEARTSKEKQPLALLEAKNLVVCLAVMTQNVYKTRLAASAC
jgi:hypothetical protein